MMSSEMYDESTKYEGSPAAVYAMDGGCFVRCCIRCNRLETNQLTATDAQSFNQLS